jgi:hypothetical protein
MLLVSPLSAHQSCSLSGLLLFWRSQPYDIFTRKW